MTKRKITRADFYAELVDDVPSCKYRFTYSPRGLRKKWVMYSNDSTIFDELRDDNTTQKRLNEIKSIIKWWAKTE